MDLLQQIVLGIVQGIFEWLPFSSEGFLLLVQSNFFEPVEINFFIRQALFLHLGTFFAALIYFRKEVSEVFKGLRYYKKVEGETKKLINFLIIATVISGFVGLAFLQALKFIDTQIIFTSKIITLGVGIFLLATGFLQLKSKSAGTRNLYHLNNADGVILGFVQGLASLPGLSRSGLTISALLLRNLDETQSLRLSFIMSLPIVLMGNIILNFSDFSFISDLWLGVLVAFIFGWLTIHLLMKLSKTIRFGYFVILMAILVIGSSFLI